MNSSAGSGACQPPRKSVTAIPLEAHIAKYSAMKKSAYLKPEYSVRCPEISSLSASGRSNGDRLDSASAEIRGRDLVTGLPKTVIISTEQIRKAMEEPVTRSRPRI